MTAKIIDIKKVSDLAMEINQKTLEIISLIQDENDSKLKHLAACSIHLSIFLRELYEFCQGNKDYDKVPKDSEKKYFLENCGCDFNGVKQ